MGSNLTYHILAIYFVMILEHTQKYSKQFGESPWKFNLPHIVWFYTIPKNSILGTRWSIITQYYYEIEFYQKEQKIFFPVAEQRRNWMKYLWSSMYSMNSFRTMRFWISFFFCVCEQYITHEYCENVAHFTIHFYVSIVYTNISYIVYVIVKRILHKMRILTKNLEPKCSLQYNSQT